MAYASSLFLAVAKSHAHEHMLLMCDEDRLTWEGPACLRGLELFLRKSDIRSGINGGYTGS